MKRRIRRLGKPFILILVFVKAEIIYRIFGIDHLSNYINGLSRQTIRHVLSRFGAKIGNKASISTKIVIDNAVTNDYSHLVIGNRCYIGKNVFFDLVEPVVIEDEGVISARVTFLTHSDPGERLLRKYFDRSTGEIRVGKGAWIGACATIMPGVTIGEGAVVGANALVNKDIPPYSVAAGVPAKIIRKLNE